MSETSSYKATKWKAVGRVADEAVVLLMFCESGTEGRVCAELRRPKNGRSVPYPARVYEALIASGSLDDAAPQGGVKVQESRLREHLTYGLRYVHLKNFICTSGSVPPQITEGNGPEQSEITWGAQGACKPESMNGYPVSLG